MRRFGFGSSSETIKRPQSPWGAKQLLFVPPTDQELEYRPTLWNAGTHQVFQKTEILLDGTEIQMPVKKFTDTSNLFSEGSHIFIVGQTGTGKTSFHVGLLYLMWQKGFKGIIHRDDGGLESLVLEPLIKEDFHIWVPEKMEFKTHNWEPTNEIIYFDPKKPRKIISTMLEVDGFHTVIFDAYSVIGETCVKFWGPFFTELIFGAQQEPTFMKKKRVLSADELNDLIQPARHSWSREHQKTQGVMEASVRKLRKHRFKIVGSAHRPNQLPINVRASFAYFIFKQTFPKDAYDLLNAFMAGIPSKLFWMVLNDITHKIRVDEFYLFDSRGKFDKWTNDDMPRWSELLTPEERADGLEIGLKTSVKGSIDELWGKPSADTGQIFDKRDLIIFLHRGVPKGSKLHRSYRGLVELLEEYDMPIAQTTIADRVKKMRQHNEWLNENLIAGER